MTVSLMDFFFQSGVGKDAFIIFSNANVQDAFLNALFHRINKTWLVTCVNI
jgi:hypothetical protein